MKNILLMICLTLLGIGLVSAEGQTFTEARQLIDSQIRCDALTEGQLEAIGEYYMEQMHPGEAHELMNRMMVSQIGEKGEEQMHVQMARSLYCNESGRGMMGGGMMQMMGGFGGMGPGMIGFGYGGGWNFLNVLYSVLLIGLIILVYVWIARLWKDMKHRGSRR